MSVLAAARFATLVLAFALPAVHADIISDITISETDENSALQIKAELFWQPILSAAEDVKMEKHVQLYADAEAVIKGLPTENVYVRKTLQESLDHLKRADDVLFKQALESAAVAKEKLDAPCETGDGPFSFLKGGQNFLNAALRKFVGGGRYSDQIMNHVERRQADILPTLRGAAGAAGNILSDCRLASKKGFDVRKYDIYNEGVPKTPQAADDLADRIIDAASETRSRFTRSITDMVKGITRDFEEKKEDAAVTVTKANVKGLHAKIAQAQAQAKVEAQFPTAKVKGSLMLSSAGGPSIDTQLIDL